MKGCTNIINYSTIDFGRLLMLIILAIYFFYRFFKHKKLSNLILALIFIHGLTSRKFMFYSERINLSNNKVYIISNIIIIIIISLLLLLYALYKKIKKN